MLRRQKCTIFTDAKETTSVAELKRMIEGITKVAPEDQMLFNWKQEVLFMCAFPATVRQAAFHACLE